VEAAAEILFGSSNAFIKVDCAEFQHSHEIAKLIGSPPGYLGHRETQPIITQQALNQFQTEKLKMSFLLFDEIEKASDALWQLLLGILDKAVLTLGDNSKVDLSHTVVFMTSNLGASEMGRLVAGGIGFAPASIAAGDEGFAQRMFRVAVDAARRLFSPEFMNRIDKVIVFRTLTREDLGKILDLELDDVRRRILSSQGEKTFVLECTPEAKEFLLNEGTDRRYGARHLKRTIEQHLVSPLSSLVSSGQVDPGEVINVSVLDDGTGLAFSKDRPEKKPEQRIISS
jgi:ATP-dependent Clp protease ATP-binding subunit ClpA